MGHKKKINSELNLNRLIHDIDIRLIKFKCKYEKIITKLFDNDVSNISLDELNKMTKKMKSLHIKIHSLYEFREDLTKHG